MELNTVFRYLSTDNNRIFRALAIEVFNRVNDRKEMRVHLEE